MHTQQINNMIHYVKTNILYFLVGCESVHCVPNVATDSVQIKLKSLMAERLEQAFQ